MKLILYIIKMLYSKMKMLISFMGARRIQKAWITYM